MQTGRKHAEQVPGPKEAKRADICQHSAFKMSLCKKVGSDGKFKPWCKTCDKEPNCSKTGLNCHLKSKSHEKNQASTSFTSNMDDIWKRVACTNNNRAKSMEIKTCAFLAEHNLPISFSDGLVQFLQSLSPCDDVMKTVTLGKQKASNVIRQVLGFDYLHQAVSTSRSEKFSFIIDEATNLSTSKQLAILVTYFDMDAFESKQYLVDMVVVEAGTATHTIYLEFLSYQLERFNDFNLLFQCGRPVLHCLKPQVEMLLRSIASDFMKMDYVKATNPKKISPSVEFHVTLEDVYLGMVATATLREIAAGAKEEDV
jgi:hypothetical protein